MSKPKCYCCDKTDVAFWVRKAGPLRNRYICCKCYEDYYKKERLQLRRQRNVSIKKGNR